MPGEQNPTPEETGAPDGKNTRDAYPDGLYRTPELGESAGFDPNAKRATAHPEADDGIDRCAGSQSGGSKYDLQRQDESPAIVDPNERATITQDQLPRGDRTPGQVGTDYETREAIADSINVPSIRDETKRSAAAAGTAVKAIEDDAPVITQGWLDSVDDAPDNWLSTQERIVGEEREQRVNGLTARAAEAVGHDRARMHREELMGEERTGDRSGAPSADAVFGEFDTETLRSIRQDALHLKDLYNTTRSVRDIMAFIARLRSEGKGSWNAKEAAQKSILNNPKTKRPLGDVDPWGDDAITTEVTVISLYEPNGKKARQVAEVRHDDGTLAKLTLWKKSNPPLVQVGDRLLLETVSVNYRKFRNREISLAYTGDSRLKVLERTDGTDSGPEWDVHPIRSATPTYEPKDGNLVPLSSDDPRQPSWSVEGDTHSWVSNHKDK